MFNLVNGDGPTVGQAIASHPGVDLVLKDYEFHQMQGRTLIESVAGPGRRSVFADLHPSAEPVSGGDDPVELARWLDDLKPGDFSTQTDGV